MAADVPGIMAGLASALASVDGLRVFDYPPDTVSPPAAIVAFPNSVRFDDTMARGADRVEIPVHVVVGSVSDRASAAAVTAYLGTGPKSVKAAIESDATLGGAADTTRVTEATVTGVTIAGVDLLTATFTVEVIA